MDKESIYDLARSVAHLTEKMKPEAPPAVSNFPKKIVGQVVIGEIVHFRPAAVKPKLSILKRKTMGRPRITPECPRCHGEDSRCVVCGIND